jgi:Rv2525c-like, glycoside hydrolase-like domain
MALHGLDKDAAPPPPKAKAMLEEIHGSWWNVYIGGPNRTPASASWTPDLIRQYEDHGITRFLLNYVGRQNEDVHLLTSSQGERDGDDACQIAERFGYGAGGTPICLDLEHKTFKASPQGSLDYASGWCRAVRANGLRPGVYANAEPLISLAGRPDRPGWVWVAAWVRNTVNPNADPHRSPLPDNLWSEPGQRVWQYAGKTDDGPAKVGGVEVDINVADSGCLTRLAFDAGLAPDGLSEADVQDILDKLQALRDELKMGKPDGIPNDFVSLAGIRSRLITLQDQVTELQQTVNALTGSHPHD